MLICPSLLNKAGWRPVKGVLCIGGSRMDLSVCGLKRYCCITELKKKADLSDRAETLEVMKGTFFKRKVVRHTFHEQHYTTSDSTINIETVIKGTKLLNDI